MKIVAYISLFLCLHHLDAQELKTIYTNENQAVALFFPNEIRQAVVGSDAFTFSYNRETPQHFGLLQGVKGNSSNLLVITEVGQVYSYFVDYRENVDTLNYFIQSQERIGFEKPFVKVAVEDSVPYTKRNRKIDSLGASPDKRVEYFKKFSEFHLKRNRNSLKKKRKNGLILHLKDLIYDRTEVYVLIEIKNKSGIDFELDYLKIFKVNGNKRKKSSYQKIEMNPIYKHNLPKILKEGASRDFVLTVPKFTFGDKEKLLLELKERRGNRILQLFYD